MLKFLRKNTKVVIWTVVIAFILWGGFAVGTQMQGPGTYAGKVFGKKISIQEFNQFYRANQIFSFSENPITDPNLLRQQTWQSLILSKEAENQGFKVTDDEVRKEIYRLFESQDIQNPTPEFYERWLQSTVRETPQQFEKQIRELLLLQKLIKTVNDPPVDPPTEEQIRKRFELNENSLSLEMAPFETEDEAKSFYENHSTPKTWDQFKEENPKALLTTEKASLTTIVNSWRIPENEVLRLHGLETQTISEPVNIFNTWFVFYIKDKDVADEQKYETELKEQIKEEINQQRRYQRFMEWNFDVNQRAQLEDYLPRDTPAPGPIETNAEPPPATE